MIICLRVLHINNYILKFNKQAIIETCYYNRFLLVEYILVSQVKSDYNYISVSFYKTIDCLVRKFFNAFFGCTNNF